MTSPQDTGERLTGEQCRAGLKALRAHAAVTYADEGTIREIVKAVGLYTSDEHAKESAISYADAGGLRERVRVYLRDSQVLCRYILTKPELYDDKFAKILRVHLRESGAILTLINDTPAPSQAGWRPIESAPRDGTRVLICVPALSEHVFACGFEYGNWQTGVWSAAKIEPSHWQPLPEPPDTRTEGEAPGEEG